MKKFESSLLLVAIVAVCSFVGCTATATKEADVTDSIRKSLGTAGLKDVVVSQDRDKGIVTLSGHVTGDLDKRQASSIAKSFAGGQVVSNQIAVVPVGTEKVAEKVNSALDKGIESNLEAAMLKEKMPGVKYTVKNHLVTLSGEVTSQSERSRAEKVALDVPNVQQVVNELQVKRQKATSSN